MSQENQGRTPKKTQEVYVPPARRSESGSSVGGTPNSKLGSPQKATPSDDKPESVKKEIKEELDDVPLPPPNCCEDIEDGELDSTPEKAAEAPSWRTSNKDVDQKMMAIVDTRRTKSEQKRNKNNDIPIIPRPIKSRSETSSTSGGKKEKKETNQVVTVTNVSTNNRFQQSSKHPHPYGEFKKIEKEKEIVVLTDLDKFLSNEVLYIDSHCHTDFIYQNFNRSKSDEGVNEWMERCPDGFPKGLAGFIANFIQPTLWVRSSETLKSFDLNWVAKELASSKLYLGTTWGCHPHHAKKWGNSGVFWSTLEKILEDGSKWKVLAVGECGVDLHKCSVDLEIQKMVFRNHVQLAFKYGYPLVIHCRNGAKGQAEDSCLEVLDQVMRTNHRNLKIHRHCYTEDWETARRWLKLCPDVHFGFTPGIYTFRESQIEAVRQIPLDRILLETDAPYFKPKSFDSVGPAKCSLPGMAIATAHRIAEIKEIPFDEVLRATFNNTRRVYQLPVY